MFKCVTADCHQIIFQKMLQADTIFTGRIVEFFGPKSRLNIHRNYYVSTNLSALIEVKRVYRDPSLSETYVVVEMAKYVGEKGHFRPFSVGDTRLFFTSVWHYGVYNLHSPMVPITLKNIRRANKLEKIPKQGTTLQKYVLLTIDARRITNGCYQYCCCF